jgi:uncharacterized protein
MREPPSMRALFASALLTLGTSTAASAQSAPVIHANTIIPNPPPSAKLADWTNAGGRTTVTFRSDDGATLRGWKYAGADPSAPVLLFFNANPRTIDKNDALYRTLAAQGPDVVVFDYRGYGFSEGTPDVAAFERDATSEIDVAAGTAKRPVVVYGFSMGTALAVYAAAQRPLAGLILAAPFSSARDEFPIIARAAGMPADVAASVVIAPDAETAFDEVGYVARSSAPLLVVHGTDDQDVPIALGRKLFAASTAVRKQFLEVPGVKHGGIVSAPASLAALRAFVASLHT